MQVKVKVEGVEDITKDDLVNLFSTGLYGSVMFAASYDKDFYNGLGTKDIEDCFEDKMAKVLLDGGEVYVWDMYAQGSDEHYGDLRYKWEGLSDGMRYTLKLENIKKGLEIALEGDSYTKKCAYDLIDEDGYNLDLTEAETLLRCILFGELLYG